MKKFWRSGMIDKKVVKEREEVEYINKLQRTILELRRDDVGDLINDTTDYDEIRIGDNVVLDFKDGCIVVGRKDSVKDSPTLCILSEMRTCGYMKVHYLLSFI